MTLQLTLAFAAPVTVAANCCVAFTFTLTEAGERVTATLETVIVALADFVASACEVAVTVTVLGLGVAVGAL